MKDKTLRRFWTSLEFVIRPSKKSLAIESNEWRFDGGFDRETVNIDSSTLPFLFRIHEGMVGMAPSVPLQIVLLSRKMEFSMHATKSALHRPLARVHSRLSFYLTWLTRSLQPLTRAVSEQRKVYLKFTLQFAFSTSLITHLSTTQH